MTEILDAIVANTVAAWLDRQAGASYVVVLIAIALTIGIVWRWRHAAAVPTAGHAGAAQSTGNFIAQHFHLGGQPFRPPSIESVSSGFAGSRAVPGRSSDRSARLEDAPITGQDTAVGFHSRAQPARVVRVDWHEENTALHVDVTNTSSQTIHDCRLYLLDLRRYQPSVRQFVEVRMFHDTGPFARIQLLSLMASGGSAGDTKLFCGDPVTFQFLLCDAAQLAFVGRTDDSSILNRHIGERGIWEATFMCMAGGQIRMERMCFRWDEVGGQPRPVTAAGLTHV
jgi:hypothetical protein